MQSNISNENNEKSINWRLDYILGDYKCWKTQNNFPVCYVQDEISL